MKIPFYSTLNLLLFFILPLQGQDINSLIRGEAERSMSSANALYTDLHANPELSFMEVRTSSKMAELLRGLGFEVTTGIGGNGVAGVLRNGDGPVVMLRTDMDALPVKEVTGLPFASTVIVKDASGTETPVMHACGHDLHMTVWWGTLNTLVSLKDKWHGTLVAVAQPAEEVSGGSSAMIADGLFSRLPAPDYALAFHVSADMPAGTVGYLEGAIFAGVTSVDVTVRGIGGHGAMPHKTIDPIVLAARIILDYQTIVSREINPVSPAVVTVGSIHGGTRSNIIPPEVKLQMTVRFFSDEVREQILSAIKRISSGDAIAAGLNEDLMPVVTYSNDFTPPVVNDAWLTQKATGSMAGILGRSNVERVSPSTVAEDFGRYGRTSEKVKIALFWLGGVNPADYKSASGSSAQLPALHNGAYCPDFGKTYTTGVCAMSRAITDLFNSAPVSE